MSFDRDAFAKVTGLLLQTARKRRQLTQGQLAAEIGVNRASYANVEAGRQRVPMDIVWRAAVVLRVQLASLVPEPMPAARSIPPKQQFAAGLQSTSIDISALSSPVPLFSRKIS
jgi:transcriptional regulator with XRE-family HTH domain